MRLAVHHCRSRHRVGVPAAYDSQIGLRLPQVTGILETLMALALTSSACRHDGPISRLHTAYDKDKKETPPR
jgi:hypothetical protein